MINQPTQNINPLKPQNGIKHDIFTNLCDIFHGSALQRTVEQGTELVTSIMQDYNELSRDIPIQLEFARTGVTSLHRYISLEALLDGGSLQLSYGRLSHFGERENRNICIMLPQLTYLEAGGGNWDASRQLYRGLRVELELEQELEKKVEKKHKYSISRDSSALAIEVNVSLRQFILDQTFTLDFPSYEKINSNNVNTEVINTALPLYKLGQPYIIQHHHVAKRIGLSSLAVTFKICESDLMQLSKE